MADIAITALPTASTVTGADIFPLVQGGVTKRASIAQLPASGGIVGAAGDEVTLTDYLPTGYVTDGSVAYDAGWDAAIGAGTKLYVPAGVWLLSTAKTIPNTVASIRLHPAATVRTTVVGAQPFARTGTVASASTTVTAATKGAVTVTVGSAAGIAAGTWLYLTSDDPYPNDATQKVAFLRRVTTITGTTVTLDSPIFRAMPTNAKAYVATLAPPLRLEGGVWEHGNPAAVTGSRALWMYTVAARPVFVDMTVQKNGGAGIRLDHCVGGSGRNVHLLDLLNDSANNHFGYGFSFDGATRDFVWESGTAARIRHAVTTGGAPSPIPGDSTSRGEPDSCKVLSGVTVSDTTDAALDTHGAGYNIQFLGPTVKNVGIGAQTRSDQTVIDIITVGVTLYGVQVLSTATNAHVTVQMRDPSPATTSGGFAVRNVGVGTRIGPSEQINPPSGWGAVRSDTDYVLTGAGRLDGAFTGTGSASFAGLDFGGDLGVPPGGGGVTVLPATNSQSGTGYTVAVTDVGNIVENSGGSILTVTIPTNATVLIPVGSVVELFNYSTGSITITPATGVTVRSPSGLRLLSQYASAALRKRGTDEWVLAGVTVA